MGRVDGKIAIVTGAGREGNIGIAVCEAFLREGMAGVVATDFRTEEAEAIVERLESGYGKGRFLLMTHDVTSEADWASVVTRTVDAFGTIDVLVNNAGMAIRGGVEQTSIVDVRKVMAVNHDALIIGMQLCLPYLAQSHKRHPGGGSIINTLSMASYMPRSNNLGYHVSKAAGRMLTMCAAEEFGSKHIRVNSVHPGVIETPLIREAMEEYVRMGQWESVDAARQNMAGLNLLRISGDAADLAHAYIYLASCESRFVTASALKCDGGIGRVY